MGSVLTKYIPHEAIPLVAKWFKESGAHLKIKKPRTTKFGDFRPAIGKKPHRISVNGDLNLYHFLITLIHEFAHVYTWIRYKNKVKPHGKEWKKIYTDMLLESMEYVPYPDTLQKALRKHVHIPKASSCSDPVLYALLRQYDSEHSLCLSDLEEGELFIFQNKRAFKKGTKRRTRYECLEIKTSKIYLINGQAPVKRANEKDNNLINSN